MSIQTLLPDPVDVPPIAWPECTLLANPRESVPYPLESLPPILRDAVTEVHDYMQAPLALIATSALTACSACVQAHCDVARDAVLKAPTSLFSLILAESGERKTAVDGLFMRPIHDHDRHHAEIGFANKQAHEAAFEAWETQHKALAAKLAKAAKDGDAKAIEATQKAMEASASKQPKKVRIPSLLIDDATPEAVMQSLVQSWPIGYLATSEGGSFFGGHGMKDEAIMRNLAMFNSRWDGSRSKIQRSKAEPLEVNGVRLSACVMVQPHVLDNFMRSNGTVARGSGFLARFLVTWPESTQGSRQYKPPGAMPALTRLQHIMRDLLDTAPPLNAMNQVDVFTLELSAQGFEVWEEVYNAIESHLASDGEFSDIRDSASKAADNVARIAAVFHSLEGRMGKIQADSVEASAEVVLYHLREVQRLFDGVAVPEPVQHAKALEDWLVIRATVGVPTSVNEILQHHPSRKLRKKESRNAAIELLEEHGRAREFLNGNTKMIELNPAILEVRS
jgi:putative DNA primase/helicase